MPRQVEAGIRALADEFLKQKPYLRERWGGVSADSAPNGGRHVETGPRAT